MPPTMPHDISPAVPYGSLVGFEPHEAAVAVLHPALEIHFRLPRPPDFLVFPEDQFGQVRTEHLVGPLPHDLLPREVHKVRKGLVDLEEPGMVILEDKGHRDGGEYLLLERQRVLQPLLELFPLRYIGEVAEPQESAGRLLRRRRRPFDTEPAALGKFKTEFAPPGILFFNGIPERPDDPGKVAGRDVPEKLLPVHRCMAGTEAEAGGQGSADAGDRLFAGRLPPHLEEHPREGG